MGTHTGCIAGWRVRQSHVLRLLCGGRHLGRDRLVGATGHYTPTTAPRAMKESYVNTSQASIPGQPRRRHARLLGTVLTMVGVALLLALGAGSASASKQIIDYFGAETGTGTFGGEFDDTQGVAVNNSGAGAGNPGDIYVVDGQNNRIQRFGRDDSGTPGEPGDDSYSFISVWGAGVDSTIGGSGYQICVVASQCQAGLAAGGNGALGNNDPNGVEGALQRKATGVAVDQDSGQVYVTDSANFRVNVYEGDGTFLRSFGYDVVASGPGKVTAGSEQQQLTVKANGG